MALKDLDFNKNSKLENNQSIQTEIERLADKILSYRIFADENDQMNLNVMQTSGELLIVSQFTLVADTHKGLRPSFSKGQPLKRPCRYMSILSSI